MNKKLMAIKVLIAIASITSILPAIVTSIDVCFSSLVHLEYSAWYHIHIVPELKFALPAIFILCCLGILYSFNLQLKIKTDPDIADMVFPPLFLAGGLFCLLAPVDLYFSRAAFYSHSALFHMNVKEYRILAFGFIAPFPFVALLLYTLLREPIVITKKPEVEQEEEL